MKPGGGKKAKNRLILRPRENTMKRLKPEKAGKQPDFAESENTIKSLEGRSRRQRGGQKAPARVYGEKLKYHESDKKKRPLRTFSQGGGEKH